MSTDCIEVSLDDEPMEVLISALMAVKEYLHDSVSIPLAELAESKEVEAVQHKKEIIE